MGNAGRQLTDGGEFFTFIKLLLEILEFRDVPLYEHITVRPLHGPRRHQEASLRTVSGRRLDLKGAVDALFHPLPDSHKEVFVFGVNEFREMFSLDPLG